jgi:hypothetical protein
MVTSTHEAHHSIFRHHQDLFPEVMGQVFGVVLGKTGRVTCLSTDLNELRPMERRADSVLLAELVEAGLDGTSSYQIRRELMITNDYPHVSQRRAQATEQGLQQGIAEGSIGTRIKDILRTLARRNIDVPKDEREDIESCTDMHTLEVWLDRSYVIKKISELFAE